MTSGTLGGSVGRGRLFLYCALIGLVIAFPFASDFLATRYFAPSAAHKPKAPLTPIEKMCGENCHLNMGPQEGETAVIHAGTSTKNEGGEASTVNEKVGPDGFRIKTVLFKNILIDKLYPSMTGPQKVHHITLGDPQDVGLWVRSYRAEVLDGKSGEASQEYMCHTNVDLVGVPGTEAQQYQKQELSIAQGQKQIEFPEGFALRFFNDPLLDIHVMVMVLNNNQPSIHRLLDFKTTIKYCTDSQAQSKKLIPLYQTGVCMFPLVDPATAKPGEVVLKTATSKEIALGPDGRPRTGHWLVPPGHQVITEDVTGLLNLKQDTTVHYMWMHVHPYAQWVEVRDKTANESLWKGTVENDPDKNRAAVISTQFFTSVQGKPLYKDHEYELTSCYDNPTGHDVDAMAAIWMYCRSHQAINGPNTPNLTQ